jgi:Secretion system C-terminal sorting domain
VALLIYGGKMSHRKHNQKKYFRKKIFKYYLIAQFFIISENIWGQGLQILWEKTYDAGDLEYPSTVITSNDTCLLICGNKINTNNGYSDILLIKTDNSGNILWQNIYGGERDDAAVSAYLTYDNSYLIVGYTNSFKNDTSNYDIYLLKITMGGDTIWSKTIGTDSAIELDNSSILTSDNNILIVGSKTSLTNSNTDMLLIKMDQDGNVIWEKTYGGEEGADDGEYVLETGDKGFLITGETGSYGIGTPFFTNIYFIRTDVNGDSLWTRYYGNIWYDYPRSILKTNDNSYIVSGWYATNGTEVSDISVLKIQDNGDISWARLYGADGFEYSYGSVNIGNNNFLLIGTTNSVLLGSMGSYDIYLMNINIDGDTIWTKTIGTSAFESAKGMVKTNDGNYIIYGQSKPFYQSNSSDVLLVKVNFNSINGITGDNNSIPSDFVLQQNFPNPFNPTTKIKYSIPFPPASSPLANGRNEVGFVTLKVYDILGREIITLVNEFKEPGNYEVEFNAGLLASGIYFYKLQAGSFVEMKKMILLK